MAQTGILVDLLTVMKQTYTKDIFQSTLCLLRPFFRHLVYIFVNAVSNLLQPKRFFINFCRVRFIVCHQTKFIVTVL